MVPLLVVKLEEIVRFYYLKVILPVTMKKANSTLKLIKFEFFYENIYWPDVEVGYGVAEELRKLENKGKIKDDLIHKFKRECRSFLTTLCKHMVEKSPLQSSFACCTRALNPVYMAKKLESCKALFDKTLQKLVEYKQVLPNIADFAKQEFDCFLTLIVKEKSRDFVTLISMLHD